MGLIVVRRLLGMRMGFDWVMRVVRVLGGGDGYESQQGHGRMDGWMDGWLDGVAAGLNYGLPRS